ncbi:amidohydrolase [Occultella glacieicola]|uniref:Amidohydrolase n=1 Tax=Occultella glacieicola TaxID=2518684 RepID=A0ABY2E7L2_9MICO|nr:amidohydrolase [Occultella glacieicola]TDE97552.1 amidohydrolase [Occultella glacieicola]
MSKPAVLTSRINALAAELDAELRTIRRDIHANPELARTEHRTSELVAARLEEAGLTVHRVAGTGLYCDIDPAGTVDAVQSRRLRRVALRADMDALPLQETSGLEYTSTVKGVSHACGHDAHTAVVLGAGLILATLAAEGLLEIGVRLIFQPAEELQPGGALDLIESGVLAGVDQIYAIHCDPKFDAGQVGTRIGPITSASDTITVTLSSTGGHTSRPHLTGDVVYALGLVATLTPALLGRRLDPRSGVNLTWGTVRAGTAANAIPSVGVLTGTLRCLDARAWDRAEDLLRELIDQVVAPTGVDVDLQIQRGVPPVDNDERCVRHMDDAAETILGPDSVLLTEQSLGGEDFGWYLTRVPGSMARLGTRTPGGRTFDLHQADLVIDESAIGVGARFLAQVAVQAEHQGIDRRTPTA